MGFDRTSLFLFLFSVFICVESYRMDVGTLSRPGPGLFPFLSGAALAMLSIAGLLARVVREEEPGAPGRAGKYKVLLVLCSLLAYGVLLERAGFLVTTFCLLLFLLRVIVPQGWGRVFCAALLSTLASYLIFDIWLKAQLPRGFIGF
ncbi:MAG: tripartite tricarboxylate transporter TctB family protein [candidate division WOR-3 bacterium]